MSIDVIEVVAPLLHPTTNDKKRGVAQQKRLVGQAVKQLLKVRTQAPMQPRAPVTRKARSLMGAKANRSRVSVSHALVTGP